MGSSSRIRSLLQPGRVVRLVGLIAALSVLPFSVAARAESLRDLEIAARVLSFQKAAPRGAVRLAIVYDSTVPGAAAAAKSLAASAGPRLLVGDLQVQPFAVPQSALAQTSNVAGVLALSGVKPDLLRAAMRRLRVPCLTTDRMLVQSGSCAVGIQSEPTVQITINRRGASEDGVEFATAFLMMVNEI